MRVDPVPAARTCAVLVVVAACTAGSCAHNSPSPEDRERAITQRDLGADALHKKDYRQALDALQKGQDLNPEDADIQYALGIVYFAGFNRMEDAEKHFRKAAELRENFSDAHNAWGNVLLARNRCDEAIPHFRKAMDNLTWPTPYLAEQNLGWCLYKQGKKDQGVAHLKNAVNLHPPLCGGYDYLARIYTEEKKDPDAQAWLEKYVKFCDTDEIRGFLPPGQLAGVFYRLGMSRVRQGDAEQGRAALATCVERFPETDAAEECRKSLSVLE